MMRYPYRADVGGDAFHDVHIFSVLQADAIISRVPCFAGAASFSHGLVGLRLGALRVAIFVWW